MYTRTVSGIHSLSNFSAMAAMSLPFNGCSDTLPWTWSGNTWRFKGHWSVNETGANPDWQNRQHLVVVENDLLISETDAPNLKLTYTREVMWRDGVRIRRNSDFSVTCLNVNAR